MINACTYKENRGELSGYYRARLVVQESGKRSDYLSKDIFVTKETALKHAEAWRLESLKLGQVVDF